MSGWVALVPPRKNTQDKAGMCLRYAQSFFGAPARHRSAWHAWLAQQHRHGVGTPLPDVPVLLWFSHFGHYNDGLGPYDGVPVGGRANWGHVAAHVPGDAIYTSPASGFGFGRYGTVAEIERTFNARYVGWSEDINGLRVAQPGEEDDMFSNDDRAMLANINRKVNAIYDGVFTTSPTSRGTRGGILKTLKAIDDAQFKTEPTTLGTPGGTLVNDRTMIEKLDAITEHLGISDDGDEITEGA